MSQPLDTAIQTLVSRLETVTARLEKVEKQLATGAPAGGAGAAAPAAAAASSGADVSGLPSIVEYDQLVHDFIGPYVANSNKIGDLVAKQAALVEKAVAAQRAMLVVAAQSRKPTGDDVSKLFKPTQDAAMLVVEVKEKAPRSHAQFNHLSAVAEGIAALGWVTVSPAPVPYIKEAGQSAAEFYTNKVLKDFKGKDQTHVDWVGGWHGFLVNLQPYVKKNHTTGVVYSGQGNPLEVAAGKGPAAGGPPPAPKGPPPPPAGGPPPAPSAPAGGAPAAGGAAHDTSALMSELSKGLDVTKKLKKLDPSLKTKNRPVEERSSLVKADDVKPKKSSSEKKSSSAPTKPPKFALEGNKWCVENIVGPKEIEIKETETRQTVYIFKCKDVVVKVSGKINSIAVDSCDKVGVLFENAISSVEVVNSHMIQVQCTGKVPSFAVDKTSGFNLYLSKECLDAEIVSSKSDSMNVVLPAAKEGEDVTEIPIPEQFKTTIKNRKLITDSVRHE